MRRCRRSFRAVRNCTAGTFAPTTSRGWGSTWTRRKRRSTHLCSSCRRGRWPAGPTGPPCGRRALSRVLELLSRMPRDVGSLCLDHGAGGRKSNNAPLGGEEERQRSEFDGERGCGKKGFGKRRFPNPTKRASPTADDAEGLAQPQRHLDVFLRLGTLGN